jgi:hypothetical protein
VSEPCPWWCGGAVTAGQGRAHCGPLVGKAPGQPHKLGHSTHALAVEPVTPMQRNHAVAMTVASKWSRVLYIHSKHRQREEVEHQDENTGGTGRESEATTQPHI